MTTPRPLFIPVILGTSRQGRMNEHAAAFMVEEITREKSASLDTRRHAKHHTVCGI